MCIRDSSWTDSWLSVSANAFVTFNARTESAPTERDAENFEWIQGVMKEAQAKVLSDPGVKLLSVAEVAQQKGVAEGTVRSWKHRGKLRVHDVVDGSPMFHPDDVANLD